MAYNGDPTDPNAVLQYAQAQMASNPSASASPSANASLGATSNPVAGLANLPSVPVNMSGSTSDNPTIVTRYGRPGHSQTTWVLDEAKGGKESTTSMVGGKSAKTSTLGDLLANFFKMPEAQYLSLRNKMIAAKLIKPTQADAASVRAAYAKLLGDVSDMQNKQNQQITPGEYLDSLASMNGIDPNKIPSTASYNPFGAASKTPATQTQTTSSVYDMSPEDAKATLESAVSSLLGRDPTDAELHDFINAAQTAAKKNPSTSTTTETVDSAGNVHDSTTGTSGFSADSAKELAADQAKKAPDYGSYQAVATYFPALTQMLGATVG